MGQIHYASGDDNPRAPYEGVYAGNALFVTRESLLHPLMYEQEFVVPAVFHQPAEFSVAFERFMRLVRDRRRVGGIIREFVEEHLRPETVYRRICEDIGVCESMKGTARHHHIRGWTGGGH